MHRFDYRFLADSLPANLLEIAGIIYDLRGKGEIKITGSAGGFDFWEYGIIFV